MNPSARKGAPAVGTVLAALAAWLWLGLAVPVSARDAHAGDFVFERLADQLGGRQSTVYDIFEDRSGFVWIAGDTDGILRFDGQELMSWSAGFHDNLTRSNVSTLRTTPDGRLWVGSWGNGLQYWDAEAGRYVQFLSDPASPHGLASNRVQRLMLDRSDRMWIGTTAGINLVKPEAPNRLTRFAHDQPDHPLHDERIWGMAEHDSGFWFATSSGVYRLSPDLSAWRRVPIEESARDRFERGAEVRTVGVAHGRIWAGSQFGAFVWDAADDRFVRVRFEDDASHPTPRVNTILESRHGGVWVGTHDGLYRIDEGRAAFVRQGETFNLVPDVDVRALFEDREGNVWIGSRDQGMLQGQRRDRVFSRLADRAPVDLAEQVARLTSAVLYDASGRLWLGIPGGLLRQDSNGNWRHWGFDGLDSPASVRRIERIREDGSGRVWVATDNGLFLVGPDDELIPDARVFDQLGIGVLAVNDFLVDSEGTLWLALWNFGIVRWHPDAAQLDDEIGVRALRETRGDMVYHLTQAADGTVWASTRYSGVFRHDDAGWQSVPLPMHGQQYPPSFYCIEPDPAGHLWLCTEDGLLRYEMNSDRSELFGIEHGLPANRVTGMLLDERFGLWVMTTQGVAWRAPDRERFVSFGLRDGLPGLGMQRNAVEPANGMLIMGSSQGAVEVNPTGASRGLTAPRTVLSRVWVDGYELTRQTDPERPRLELRAGNRDLTLQFAVLDFHEPERNLVRYRLRGFDPHFSAPTSNLQLRYMNLPPGEYELEVEGWNSRGIPSAATLAIPVRVAAPWWHSPWVWLVAAVLTAALFLASVQLRIRALRVSNERLQDLVAERTHELEEANENLRVRSARDFLTGLLNRRGFTDQFNLLQRLAVRNRSALSLILFDLDHFKPINDRLGHEAGDTVLKELGRLLLEVLRSQDVAARWGGEEFLLALPETDREGAVRLCEKLRQRLAEHRFYFQDTEIRITATFGIVSGRAAEQPLEQWVKLADEALYEGKRSGRDRIVVAPVDLV